MLRLCLARANGATRGSLLFVVCVSIAIYELFLILSRRFTWEMKNGWWARYPGPGAAAKPPVPALNSLNGIRFRGGTYVASNHIKRWNIL
jgi:hypothetical protein